LLHTKFKSTLHCVAAIQLPGQAAHEGRDTADCGEYFALGFALGYAAREAEVSYAPPSLQSRLTGAGERNFSIIIVVHARWGAADRGEYREAARAGAERVVRGR
jgi:hypothetical protein